MSFGESETVKLHYLIGSLVVAGQTPEGTVQYGKGISMQTMSQGVSFS